MPPKQNKKNDLGEDSILPSVRSNKQKDRSLI